MFTIDDALVYCGIIFAVVAIPFFSLLGYIFNNGSGRSKEERTWKAFFKWLLGGFADAAKKVVDDEAKRAEWKKKD